MHTLKWLLILSQILAFATWAYFRRFSRIEAFIGGNYYLIAHLMVLTALLSPRVFQLKILAALSVAALPIAYNLVRYLPEFKAWEALPRAERPTTAAASASRLNQRLVDGACVLGAIGVCAFILYQPEILWTTWTFFAFVPGTTFVVVLMDILQRKATRRNS